MSEGKIRGQQIRDDSLTGDDIDESTLILSFITDADGDTKVQVEETADEDKIRFDTGGTERMIILNDGAVGIGITAPANPLSVYASVSSKYVALIDNNQSLAGHGLKITSDGTGTGTYLLDLESVSDTLFRFRADGRLGIGTTTPAAKLDVVGNIKASDSLYVDKIRRASDSGTTTKIKLEANQIQFYAGGNSSVQVCTVSGDRALDVLDATNPQIRLTHSTSPSKYVDMHATEAGDFEVTGSASNSHMKFICPNGDAAMIIQSNATDGDAQLGFSVDSGVSIAWSLGVDDGDSDKFKIGGELIEVDTRLTIDGSGNVGIGTTSPNSMLHVNGNVDFQGGHKVKLRAVSATTTVLSSDYIVACTNAAAITLTLPGKSSSSGQLAVIKDALGQANTNNITIEGNSTDTIDGALSYVINRAFGCVWLVCDGINGWFILHEQ
ncbi:MAG TPA: hypothetical protein EYF95_08000 [Flavobacteriales bacterium]|nr:hypothetical protein [Flavobacteriales bacterium]